VRDGAQVTNLLADWASVDGNRPPDLSAARGAGLVGGIIRGDYSDWSDPTFARDADAVRRAGLVLGAYVMPDYSANAPSAAQQVMAAKRGAALVPGLDLPPWLDVEFSKGVAATGRGRTIAEDRTGLAGFIGDMLKALDDAFGCRAGVYGSQRVVDTDDTDTLAGAADAELADRWWWVARYALPYHAEPGAAAAGLLPGPPVPRAAGDSDAWVCHQFQGDAVHFPGFSATVDVSRWHYFTCASPRGGTRWARYAKLLGVDPMCIASEMDEAIRAFQARAGLSVDGVLGPVGHAHLGWLRA